MLHVTADDTITSQPGVTGWRQYTLTTACGSGPRGARSSGELCPPVLRQWENQRMLSSFVVFLFFLSGRLLVQRFALVSIQIHCINCFCLIDYYISENKVELYNASIAERDCYIFVDQLFRQ